MSIITVVLHYPNFRYNLMNHVFTTHQLCSYWKVFFKYKNKYLATQTFVTVISLAEISGVFFAEDLRHLKIITNVKHQRNISQILIIKYL